jgi:putative endonuclease
MQESAKGRTSSPARPPYFIQFYKMEKYFVYILSNRHHTVFYTGFTDDLERRVFEHRNKLLEGFTKKYNIYKLLYFEEMPSAEEAKHREKQLKRYKREWKKNLINSINPEWRDLYDDFLPGPVPGSPHK